MGAHWSLRTFQNQSTSLAKGRIWPTNGRISTHEIWDDIWGRCAWCVRTHLNTRQNARTDGPVLQATGWQSGPTENTTIRFDSISGFGHPLASTILQQTSIYSKHGFSIADYFIVLLCWRIIVRFLECKLGMMFIPFCPFSAAVHLLEAKRAALWCILPKKDGDGSWIGWERGQLVDPLDMRQFLRCPWLRHWENAWKRRVSNHKWLILHHSALVLGNHRKLCEWKTDTNVKLKKSLPQWPFPAPVWECHASLHLLPL